MKYDSKRKCLRIIHFRSNMNFRFVHRDDQRTWLLKITVRYLRSENIKVYCIFSLFPFLIYVLQEFKWLINPVSLIFIEFSLFQLS